MASQIGIIHFFIFQSYNSLVIIYSYIFNPLLKSYIFFFQNDFFPPPATPVWDNNVLCLSTELSTISFVICLDFSMFCQIFLSSQVERCAIITYKHGIYEFPHELPKSLRPLRKLRNISKLSKFHRRIA